MSTEVTSNSNIKINNSENGIICSLSDSNICVEFLGTSWSLEQITNVCVYYQGGIKQSKCEPDNIIAECILNKGLENEARLKYYSPITLENAAMDCDRANGILK